MRGRSIRACLNATVIVSVISLLAITPAKVFAASITTASDTLSTTKESVLANHTIQFITPTGIPSTGLTLTITFPTGFSIGTFAILNEDINEFTGTPGSCSGTTTAKTLATSNGVATWGAASAGQVFTFTSPSSGAGNITAGNCVQIIIGASAVTGGAGANIITNQTAAQNVSDPKILIGGTMTDSGTIAVSIVANNTVAVTAAVNPFISCSIDTNTASFGTFATGTVTTAGSTPIWTISTNGALGYSLTVRSAGNGTNAGLYASTPNYVIKSADSAEASSSDLSVSATIGYGLQGTKTNGDAGSSATTISAPYTSTATTVGRLQLTDQTLASAAGIVSSATITSTLKAKVTGLVPAGSYADTLTYVCTGIF